MKFAPVDSLDQDPTAWTDTPLLKILLPNGDEMVLGVAGDGSLRVGCPDRTHMMLKPKGSNSVKLAPTDVG